MLLNLGFFGPWAQPVTQSAALLRGPLGGACLLQGRLMVVQLDLSARRWADRVRSAAGRSPQAPLAQAAGLTDLPREAKERYWSPPAVARHAAVDRGHACRAGHAALPIIGR